GATSAGGPENAGTLFKIKTDGSGYSVLYNFGNSLMQDRGPCTGLLLGDNGTLFGTTSSGGDLYLGSIFELFSAPPAIKIGRIQLTGAGAQLSFSGAAAGQTCQIEASTN